MPRAESPTALVAALQAEIERCRRDDPGLPGITVTLRAPRLALDWSGACGEGFTPASAFRIASVSKVFVASAALRLVETGVWSLFTPIERWLGTPSRAALRDGGHAAGRITLHMLLTHTSGLPDHATMDAYRQAVLADPARRWTREEQIALAMGMPPLAVPGGLFAYSDTGYLLVGEMIENASGRPLFAVVRDACAFERLGLTQTHWERHEPTPADQRRALQRLGGLDAATLDPSLDLHGGGGLISTTGELATWLRALLRGEVFERPETLAAGLMTPSVRFNPGDWLHAGLLRGRPVGGHAAWLHGGYWGVLVAYLPASDLTLALSIHQAEPLAPIIGSTGEPGLADRLIGLVERTATSNPT